MTARQVRGQLELDYAATELTAEQRAVLAAQVQAGWRSGARCVERRGQSWFRLDPDNWFPDVGDTHARRTAFAWCFGCPVRRSCLAFALSEGEEHGIWAGTTEFQRYDLLSLIASGVSPIDVLDAGLAAAHEAFYAAGREDDADSLPPGHEADDEADDWGDVA